MEKTIEALYKDGKIFPLTDTVPVKEARVLITFLDNDKKKKVFAKRKGLKLTTYHSGGKLRDFVREDAYGSRI
jgi:hypothetical protein